MYIFEIPQCKYLNFNGSFYSQGRVVFSSGSPFPPVEMNGKTFSPGQGNNAYIFPGIALGVITTGTHHISDDMFLIAARELANFVDQSDLDRGSLYPPLNAVREVSMRIAEGVTKCAYDKGMRKTYLKFLLSGK